MLVLIYFMSLHATIDNNTALQLTKAIKLYRYIGHGFINKNTNMSIYEELKNCDAMKACRINYQSVNGKPRFVDFGNFLLEYVDELTVKNLKLIDYYKLDKSRIIQKLNKHRESPNSVRFSKQDLEFIIELYKMNVNAKRIVLVTFGNLEFELIDYEIGMYTMLIDKVREIEQTVLKSVTDLLELLENILLAFNIPKDSPRLKTNVVTDDGWITYPAEEDNEPWCCIM